MADNNCDYGKLILLAANLTQFQVHVMVYENLVWNVLNVCNDIQCLNLTGYGAQSIYTFW